jgi:hypothetical protein
MIGAAGNETINNDVQPPYPASLSTLNDAVDCPATGNILETAAEYDGVIAVASIRVMEPYRASPIMEPIQ